MKARQKVRRKGAAKDRVFGCDLLEHLQHSGQEVPQVLRSCTEFVEQHGIVDGIYRLSGVSSNIQKLRQEFDGDRCPDLNKDVYLQDIHCVSSLCKAYFRELPNPLLTYQLYDKFADAVAIQLEEGRLVKIKEVLKELPLPHYRTLEFLMRHLVHMASYSSQTNMHARNLAIVWAPNLLRSKDIEASGFNGTAAFMEVRVQSIVVEFILTHVEQLFRDAPLCGSDRESVRKSLLLSGSGIPGVLSDCHALSYNVPTMLNQGDGPPQMRPYHTIIELNDHKRKGSLKVKKWKSIFNLGRYSNDSKRKLAKPEEKDDKPVKMSLRPAKSMDSLSSMTDTSDGRRPSSSLPSSFLESDEYPNGKFKSEEGQQTLESEGEATAKSEPTTPKAGRASLVGGFPQGRSPKTARNRAEKCAGVHISVPFSVTVPFHITSNINLSRLTRGLECPALRRPSLLLGLELESNPMKNDHSSSPLFTPSPLPTRRAARAPYPEENRLSLEVQDSFSFLDNPDTWQDCGTESDQPEKNLLEETTSDFIGDTLDGFPVMDDDMESQFMSLEEFSVEPPPEYLSIEDCMNDELYYLATGCSDAEELSKETDSEDVFLSAYDDLSPLATDLEKLQEFSEENASAMPPQERTHGGEMAQELQCKQPMRPAKEGSLPSDANGFSSSEEGGSANVPLPDCPSHAPESAKPLPSQEAAEEPASDLPQPEILKDDSATELNSAVQQEEDTKITGRKGESLEAGCALHRASPGPHRTDPAPAGKYQGTWALKSEHSAAPASYAGDKQVEDPWLREAVLAPCALGGSIHKADECAPEEVRAEEDHGGSAPPTPQIKQPGSGEGSPQDLAMEAASVPLPGMEAKSTAVPICESDHEAITPFLETGPEVTTDLLPESVSLATGPLLGSDPETTIDPLYESSPMATAPFLEADPEATTVSLYESSPEAVLWLEISPDTAAWSETAPEATLSLGSGPTSLPLEFGPLQMADPTALLENDVPTGVRVDGSAPMRVTSSTVRVQQVKSVPVVPPKPQFARIPPAVKMKMHLGEACCGGAEKQASWRNGGSMSFDTAVALAKERHLAQTPVRRIQTYCGGDGQEGPGSTKVEKSSPFPRSALKPVGQRPLRPLSCTGTLPSPDALPLGKHPTLPDTAYEPRLAPSQEPLPFAQEPTSRSRLSLPRLGQRLADTEEGAGAVPPQRRSLAFEIRDYGGTEEL
uniref:Rho GTPase activating protein 30 n=1 Tax=Pelusios castaneus TaxID=367368 RepID=A0A8C8VR68_9SAUR